MRISTSGTVRARVAQVARADQGTSISAKKAYDGTSARLTTAMRIAGFACALHGMNHHQNATSGAAARPHTADSTSAIATTVTPTRQITTARTDATRG